MRGQRRPRAGDLHGVDDEPAADERLELRPRRCGARATARRARRRAVGAGPALLVDDRHGGVDQRRVALVEHEQHGDVAGAGSCGRPRRRRRGGAPPAWRRGAGCDGRRRARRRTTRSRTARRRSCAGAGCSAQPGTGDDAERALAADEELVEVGAGGLAGVPAGVDRACRRRGRRRGRRPCPRSCRSGSRAGRRRGRRASRRRSTASIDWGQWPTVSSCWSRSSCLEVRRRRCRRSTSRMSDVVVDVDDARQAAQVEHDAAVQRAPSRRTRRCARPPAVTGTRASLQMREDGGDLVGVGGAGHGRGERRDLAVEGPRHGERPPVAARLGRARRRRSSTDAHAPAEPPTRRRARRRLPVGRGARSPPRRRRRARSAGSAARARVGGSVMRAWPWSGAERERRARSRAGRPPCARASIERAVGARPARACCVGIPAELVGDQRGDVGARPRPTRRGASSRGTGAARQDVVDATRHLVAAPRRPPRPSGRGGPGTRGSASAGSRSAMAITRAGLAAVAVGQVVDGGAVGCGSTWARGRSARRSPRRHRSCRRRVAARASVMRPGTSVPSLVDHVVDRCPRPSRGRS